MKNNVDKYFTIIPDSGIQFLEVPISLDLSKRSIQPIHFHQYKPWMIDEGEEEKVSLELAIKTSQGIVAKSTLNLDETGAVKADQPEGLEILIPNQIDKNDLNTLVTINNIEKSIDRYKNHWLPVPFFEFNSRDNLFSFGPVGWSRMKICDVTKPKDDETSKINFNLVFAFDTKSEEPVTATTNDDPFSVIESNKNVNPHILLPKLSTQAGRGEYRLCFDENEILEFVSHEKGCRWVDKYLRSIVHDGKIPKNSTPLKYLMDYVYLIKYIAQSSVLPSVLVNPVEEKTQIPVDLVLDIGNSRTCGLLFEANSASEGHNFNSVRQLELRDLSSPSQTYSEAFSTRLVFSEFNFGDIFVDDGPDELFNWPSILRIGEEANRLLREYDIKNHNIDESANTLSSPKRYLWDREKRKQSWEYISKNDETRFSLDSTSVYYPNLTQYVSSDGTFTTEVLQGSKPNYSRGALMVFVFIELLNHAFSQINSHTFRSKNENSQRIKRYLRNLVITCPTAMSEVEQVLLKEYASTALDVLNQYHSVNRKKEEKRKDQSQGFNSDMDLSDFRIDAFENSKSIHKPKGPFSQVNIIPDPKDLKKPYTQTDEKKHWIYDEATTSQILYIYGELGMKYKDNYNEYFNLYGRPVKGTDNHALTIASLDIGGGTSDLMICKYTYNNGKQNYSAELTPDPLYWETFHIAGDDLLKDVIQSILIDGILRDYLSSIGISWERIMLIFGGKYRDPMHEIYRKNIVIQILVKIGYKFLDFLSNKRFIDQESYVFSYDDIFKDSPPNKDLLLYLETEFGSPFEFKDIQWTASRSSLNDKINKRFKDLFKQISILAFTYDVDLILLTGKPTTLPEIRNILINELPTTPDRVIAMSNHKIGDWYPFSNVRGIMQDPKTSVAVGAIIYLIGGEHRQLQGLALNTRLLIEKLLSTANYIGKYNSQNRKIEKILLSPTQSRAKIIIDTFPYVIACKQLKSDKYPSRCLFRLTKNIDYVSTTLKRIHPELSELQLEEMAIQKMNSKFEIEISRDIQISKEQIIIENVLDLFQDENVDNAYIKIEYMSLENENGYWLDTGKFKLNTK